MDVENICCFALVSECAPGHFGMKCSNLCSGHCKNNEPCDHVSGVCPSGCQNGFMEEYCNSCKKFTSSFLFDNLHIKLLYHTLYIFVDYSLQNRKLWKEL